MIATNDKYDWDEVVLCTECSDTSLEKIEYTRAKLHQSSLDGSKSISSETFSYISGGYPSYVDKSSRAWPKN
jgi:hypothetical protein